MPILVKVPREDGADLSGPSSNDDLHGAISFPRGAWLARYFSHSEDSATRLMTALRYAAKRACSAEGKEILRGDQAAEEERRLRKRPSSQSHRIEETETGDPPAWSGRCLGP